MDFGTFTVFTVADALAFRNAPLGGASATLQNVLPLQATVTVPVCLYDSRSTSRLLGLLQRDLELDGRGRRACDAARNDGAAGLRVNRATAVDLNRDGDIVVEVERPDVASGALRTRNVPLIDCDVARDRGIDRRAVL